MSARPLHALKDLESQLDERSKRTDEKIAFLQDRVKALIHAHDEFLTVAEQERVLRALKEEKRLILQENAALKVKLCEAETRNGLIQVQLPAVSSTHALTKEVDSAAQQEKQQNEKAIADDKIKKGKKGDAAKAKKQGGGLPAGGDIGRVIDVSRLLMKVGKIVGVKEHPDADSLYVEEVDVGEAANRTIISGLVKHVPIEQMQDCVAVFMCNLKPVKMRGILSQGMIMCAGTPEKIEILIPPEVSQPGDLVCFPGFEGQADEQLNPKKKIWEKVAPDLKVNLEGVACYKGAPMMVSDKGKVLAPSLTGVQIK